MSNLRKIGLLALLVVALSVTASAAVISVDVYIDENGNGLAVSGGVSGGLPYTIGQDPGPGRLSGVLLYALPRAGLVLGDVGLIEPGPGLPSDYIRFNQLNIAFYSDNADGVDALADAPGLPTQFYTNLVTIPEIGPEGSNGALYIPSAGQPGYLNVDFTMVYHIASDSAVPEPGSLLLVGLGLIGLGGKFSFRKKTV